MKIILTSAPNSFFINGLEEQKGKIDVNYRVPPLIIIGGLASKLEDIECDGQTFSTLDQLKTWISANLFKSGGGSGGTGAVNSVTGNLVGGTSVNPIVSIIGGTDKKIVGFDDEGKPTAMLINIKQLTDVGSFPSFANGIFCATAMNSETETGLLLFIEFSTTTPKAGTFPSYGTNGTLPVGNAVNPQDAINLGQINGVLKAIQGYSESATQTLTSINGVLQWV